MKIKLLIICALIVMSCTEKSVKNSNILKPSSFYPEHKAKVLVVGTFHFNYPGLDAMVSEEEDKIDVLKEPKKTEVTELVEYIKKFKPNKIGIEAYDSWDANNKLRRYKAGELQDERDERYQIAMRVAAELNLDTLYNINARSFDNDLVKIDSTYINDMFKDFDFESDDPYVAMTKEWFKANNKTVSKVHLLDYIKNMNTLESHQYGYGDYLIGDFKLDDFRGADILSIWWYNRNLRIFRKIQQAIDSPDDRIMIVIGNGHAAILRQLIECSPEYEFIEFDSL